MDLKTFKAQIPESAVNLKIISKRPCMPGIVTRPHHVLYNPNGRANKSDLCLSFWVPLARSPANRNVYGSCPSRNWSTATPCTWCGGWFDRSVEIFSINTAWKQNSGPWWVITYSQGYGHCVKRKHGILSCTEPGHQRPGGRRTLTK